MFNKSMIALAVVLSAGAISAAQAGEGSPDSRNGVVGAQQYQRGGFGYGYQYSTPDSVIVAPGYGTNVSPLIEDDTTGYAPRPYTDNYDDEPGNQ